MFLLVARHICLSTFLLTIPLSLSGQNNNESSQKKRTLKIKSSGSIALGYNYGIIPFAQNISVPSGYFKADGNINLQIRSLPFSAAFFYTDLKNVNGLNNYFRVSFDVQSYLSDLQQRKSKTKEEYVKKIPDLNKQYQLLQQKIAFLNHVDGNIEHYFNLPDSSALNLPDSVSYGYSLQVPGSISIDSSVYENNLQEFKDSISLKKQNLVSESEQLLNQIQEYKNLISGIENPSDSLKYDTLIYKNRFERFFSHVQKLDIGMCYPSHSTFLINNIPLKGINFEYVQNKKFFAFSAGTTINNLLFTNNIIQNNLQNTQNLFNFFDFNNPVNGRRIISAKAGFGDKNEDHLFFGALYGTGMQSYYYDTLQNSASSSNQKEHNVVIEIDGKLKPKKWLELDMIYGKSSVRPLADETDTINSSLTQLFSPFRSHAFLGKAQFKWDKIKSSFTFSTRWVDPFFRSFGVGFMRSDNLRYEIRTNHQLGKKIKAGFFYRKDENNLLNLFSYTTILHSGGANVRYKMNRHFTFTGIFNPVFQYSKDASTGTEFSNENYIAGFSATHSYQKKKMSVLTNLVSSYYKLFNGEINSEYLNISLSNTVSYKKFSNILSTSWFDMKGMDSLSGNTLLLYNDISCKLKKLSFGAGLKLSLNNSFGEQIGYNARVEARISKNISLELRGEKLVLGDFYNSIGLDLYRDYPYIWSGRVIINW